jgi:hypothetical protein
MLKAVSKLTLFVSQILPPYGPIESTQIDPDELIAHLLIFSSRYDRLVAGRLGGRYEARGRHR